MASTSIVCFLLLVSFAGGRAQQLITPGSTLFPRTKPSWNSSANRFAFGFYERGSDGFGVGIWLVGVDPMTMVWTALRDDPPLTSNATLDFTKDGKLLLRTGQGRETLIANTTKAASNASMLDSGNFVLYDKDSNSPFIWQSFEHPTDTILGGQTLFSGGQLFSSLTKTDHSTGRFRLKMQLDGNLVLYPTKTGDTPADAYWCTGTSGTGFNPRNFKFDLYLNNTGLLQIINETTSELVWSVNVDSSQGSSINDNITYRAMLDSDGNFRLYSHAYDESGHFTNISSKIWEAVNPNAQRNHSNVIHLGSSLSPGANRTSWLSPSGVFAFGFYPSRDGFAIGIWLINQTEKTIIWTANRDDSAVSSKATLDLTRDGKLLLRTDEQGREVYNITDVIEPAASAAMFDSGNFVLYNNNSKVIWESFDFPTDTILGSQSLSAGKRLVSSVSQSVQSSGRFLLDIQGDGNLVAYPVNSSAESDDSYWSSGTNTAFFGRYSRYSGGLINSQLTLDNSGLLVVGERLLAKSSYSDKNNEIIIHRATLDVDGIFRLYSHHFEGNNSSSMLMEWSALPNQCQVKGFCGSNSYCSGIGNKADCNCYLGFDFIDSKNKFLGCYRNFDNNACRRSKDRVLLYGVYAFENLWWGDYPYSVVQMKKEDCGKSCLEDCNCGAVLYSNDDCNKYKLPLRYGRKTENTSDTAFFKVIRENIIAAPPPPKVVTESKRGLVLILAISFGFISSLCIIFAIYSFIRYRRQVIGYRRLSENANLGLTEEFTLRSFSYDELEKVTCGFKEELGRGPFGAVYKGTISGGNKAVAVKRLEKVVEEGQREFQAEMKAIARTHHRNLVRLLGFCIEGSRKLLVYEYMSNGSVADLLFKAEMRPSWRERVKIALDVARGILYLHEECEVHIIHCNIKPQNILVDETGTAKISDFGLAKLLLPNQSRATTGAEGTSEYSYWAPEQQKNALISEKADTYSFGIVLLEIVCCRSSIEVKAPTADEIILSSWVYQCFVTGKLDKLVEDENVDFVTLERMVKVGLWCIQEDPDLRPSMKNVILMLEGAMHIPVPASPVVSLV